MDHTSIVHFSHRAACMVTVESGSTLTMFNVIVFDPPSRITLTDIIFLAVSSTEVALQCQKISGWNLGREALVVQDKISQRNLMRTHCAYPQDGRAKLSLDRSAIYADLVGLLIDRFLRSSFLKDDDIL